MPRRRNGKPVHGWLVLDKPAGMTSTQAVATVRRLYDAQKAGHAGTLDPLATGILPIALGEATKTVPFAVDGEKAYRFTVRWGQETNTDDAEGEVTAASGKRPTGAEITVLLPRFTGAILQTPPAFSAIKIDGERAYDRSRDGEAVALEARRVTVYQLRLVEEPDSATSVFEARCGKGTYVRALARDMGRALGCFGHVIALRRTRVGPFGEREAVTLESLCAAAGESAAADSTLKLLPVTAALAETIALNVSPADAARLHRGQAVLIRGRDAPVLAGPAHALCAGRIVAIGELERGELRPTRVFNLGGN